MKMKIVFVLMCAVIGLLASCSGDTNYKLGDEMVQPASTKTYQEPSRVSMQCIAIVHDDLAYGNKRGIYIIKDNKTGQEFIGVSGIGISELGSHKDGKVTRSDER